MDATLEAKTNPNRRGGDFRLRLPARRAKTPRSFAAINRSASCSSRRSTPENIRTNLLDRKKHGWPHRLPPCARREGRRLDLPRVFALRNGRSLEIARSSPARFAHSDSFRARHARLAL